MLKYPTHINADLSLLPPHSEHARALFDLIQGNLPYLSTWLTWPALMQTPLDVASFLNKAQEHNRDGKALILLLQYQGQMCGVISYNEFQANNRSANIGYWLGEKFQGRGIVSTALRRFIQYGFEDLALNKVIIRAGVGNAKSAAVAQRLGFVFEGTARANEFLHQRYIDHQIFSLLKAEWDGPSNASPQAK